MVPQHTRQLLIDLADKYETTDFIKDDPVSFPHRWKEKNDIEIAAFVSQWLAYGKRELFLNILDGIGQFMNDSPYLYIMNGDFEHYKDDNTCLYRFYKRKDYYSLCLRLRSIYTDYGGLHTLVSSDNPLQSLVEMFGDINGIPRDLKSACKRLCMFLRWMVRKNSPVDFGIWDNIDTNDLIIPLDTHVFRMSRQLGLTNRNDASMKTAKQITENLKDVFEGDPVKGDFALFGYGVTHR